MKLANLLHDIPAQLPVEMTDILAAAGTVRIERIVSRGHASPPDYWYDQDQHEWVLLMQGAATLRFAGGDEAMQLAPGDYVNIPAHVRHRVDATAPDRDTVWLAVFY
ncbi:cupin domain-containing protein [Janthinobacterium sp. 17J80-10]|uniref:cupin domain-containing protein n=1 Tax=Janthinobacterium sp. 17J80-10 TaxID=2497863 RepID=UPI0010057918|nr:cupin domain-containing protein [Janthinobacterium sp. 17J80-10]QAU32744.1 cupin domain-containing protein [Janthinobacterium sp. 17J80-10]